MSQRDSCDSCILENYFPRPSYNKTLQSMHSQHIPIPIPTSFARRATGGSFHSYTPRKGDHFVGEYHKTPVV